MARIIVQHDTDGGIAMLLKEVPPGVPGIARGVHGECTECGRKTHHWKREDALYAALRHVEGHEPQV